MKKHSEHIDKIILLGLFLLFLVLFTFSTVVTVGFAVNDTVTIDVNVTETSSIIVLPDVLSWTGATTSAEGGVQYLTIKNAGSINLTQIYAFMDTLLSEQDRPYGSGNPKEFSAGSVLTIRNETDTAYYFAGRLEWNWTQEIPNSLYSAVSTPVAWGYFRNTSFDYVWVLGTGSSYGCNDTDAQFAIEYDVDLGTTATRTPVLVGTPDASDWAYGYFSVNDASSPLDLYCVAAPADCSKIFIYHFDQRANFTNCDNSAYIQEGNLAPGYTIVLDVIPYIANGIPSGYLNTTVMTVMAS